MLRGQIFLYTMAMERACTLLEKYADAEIETGIVNALFGGDSGAQQYNLLGQEKAEWFYNKRKI